MHIILRYLQPTFLIWIFTIDYIYAIFSWCTLINLFYLHRVIWTPLRFPPHLDGHSKSTSKRSRQSTQLIRLTLRNLDQLRPTANINPSTGRGLGLYKQKFHNYLGVVAREKIPIVHNNWKDVPESLNDIIWDDILVCPLNIHVYFIF